MPKIKNINWSPPFQAPFPIRQVDEAEAIDMRSYHAAARAFHKVINSADLTFELMLQPGHCVIFNNRRVLHGRRAFESHNAQPRWLKGAYLDSDDFESQLRYLRMTT